VSLGIAERTPAAEGRILDGLSEAQRAAVLHGEGPLLIVAGAGTGKTTVLTRRIAHLIASKRARPEEILALTFTEKAAAEMAERVDQLIPYGYAETWISTFHAFGDRVLRQAAPEVGMHAAFRVLTRPEQIIFLRERLFALPLERFRPLGDPTRHIDALLTLVSRAKDEDVSPEAYLAHAREGLRRAVAPEERDEAGKQLELAEFYAAVQRLLAEAGVVDFGDQIFRTLELLRRSPAQLARLRQRHRFILVDEFQDTNHAQLEMLRLIAGDSPNLTVVGDDDQAIYRWRGAAAANLLAFRSLYPGCREVVLVDNHRSTQPILDAASRLISYNNPYRLEAVSGIDRRLRSRRPGGAPVTHVRYDTGSAEADGVAAAIAERLARGCRPRDVAVLVRSNADADPFLRALNMLEIPHRFSGSRGLHAREEVRLLVAFLRGLASPDDSVPVFYLAASELYAMPEVDLLRLNRYAGRKSRPLLEVLRGLPSNPELAGVPGAAREAAARLIADLERAARDVPRLRTGEVLYKFLQDSGWLARLSRQPTPANEARVRNIARFFDAVRAYGDVAEHDRVPAFVAHLDLLREAGDDPAVAEADPDEDAVHVLTVHKAKGLEFPIVFLVAAVEQKFPLRRRADPIPLPEALAKEAPAGGDPHLQEERRLFYVAMTRARDELVLTSASDYGSARPRKLSRFVVEALDLPQALPLPRRSRALEALARQQPPARREPGPEAPIPEDDTLVLSYSHVDDYLTCPLKYRYVRVLRVPLLLHHRVVYGSAVHKAIQQMFKARLEGRGFAEDDLVAAFRAAWVSEGFLSREHEERRLAAGEQILRRFFRQESEAPWSPTAVEREFAFYVERTKLVGRYDLVVVRDDRVSILDFKTGAVVDAQQAEARVRDSLQLDVYALAWRSSTGRQPDWVELRFLESGLAAGRRPSEEDAQRTRELIRDVAARIRRREFPAQPSWNACGGCPFRDICPHTARGPERER
jgi:DNA helicase-2/ATP-dependent DNA helicase PcrA